MGWGGWRDRRSPARVIRKPKGEMAVFPNRLVFGGLNCRGCQVWKREGEMKEWWCCCQKGEFSAGDDFGGAKQRSADQSRG